MTMQFSVRYESAELGERLRELAQARGLSLNALIVSILEEAAGVGRRDVLARYATASEEDAEELDAFLAEQRVIESARWR